MQIKDVSQAFLYHLQWKTKLRDFVDGRSGFDPAEISPEGCNLGKWLSSEEVKQNIPDAEIQELVSAHNELHETAKRVYDLRVTGQDNAAHRQLDNIVKYSMKIYSLLKTLDIISETDSIVL